MGIIAGGITNASQRSYTRGEAPDDSSNSTKTQNRVAWEDERDGQ